LFFLSNSLPLLHYANTWYQYPSFVRLDLDTHDHYTHRQKRFGDMEPNMKILIENLMKQVRDEIKQSWDDITAGFATHVNTVDKRFTELSTDMKKRDDHISVLETVAASLDISIAEWKPQVEESFHSVCLELSKVNSYFNRDAKESTITKSRVLSIESVPHHPPPGVVTTNGPRWHCVEHWNRDCGFGSVYTHTHIHPPLLIFPRISLLHPWLGISVTLMLVMVLTTNSQLEGYLKSISPTLKETILDCGSLDVRTISRCMM
jgi:hypothetical protein